MRRKSDPSSCRERLYVLVQGLSDFNPVVPMISQKGQAYDPPAEKEDGGFCISPRKGIFQALPGRG
jgi:hypothetical protein